MDACQWYLPLFSTPRRAYKPAIRQVAPAASKCKTEMASVLLHVAVLLALEAWLLARALPLPSPGSHHPLEEMEPATDAVNITDGEDPIYQANKGTFTL